MREEGGRILLMDFGLTHEHGTDEDSSGTPAYMAPELLRGQPASVASDVYAIGVLLFYLLTAQYPVDGADVAQLRAAHASGTRRTLLDVRPDLPEALARVVETAISAEPQKRFASTGQMIAALSDAIGLGIGSGARHRPEKPRGSSRLDPRVHRRRRGGARCWPSSPQRTRRFRHGRRTSAGGRPAGELPARARLADALLPAAGARNGDSAARADRRAGRAIRARVRGPGARQLPAVRPAARHEVHRTGARGLVARARAGAGPGVGARDARIPVRVHRPERPRRPRARECAAARQVQRRGVRRAGGAADSAGTHRPGRSPRCRRLSAWRPTTGC